MAALGEVETEECVAGLEHGQQHSGVGLGSGVWLYVGIFCPEQLAHAVDGQLFHLVYHFAASVIALAWVALSVLVCEVRAHGFHYLVTDEIL